MGNVVSSSSSSSSSSAAAAMPASHFTESFFQPPLSETPGGQDLETQGDQRISYAPDQHGTISSFENSNEFESFKNEFISQLNCLIEFAKIHHRDADTVEKAFKTLERRLFGPLDVDSYGDHKEIFYGAGKRALDQLTDLLGNEALPLVHRLDTVAELANNVMLCADGAANNLALAANDLNLRLGGNEIYRLKEQVSRQLMLEYIQPRSPLTSSQQEQWEAMEIHYVNALHNALAKRLGLPTYEDGFANLCKVTPEQIEGCLSHILEHMTPARLACAMADECLAQLDTTMQAHFTELQNGDTSASFAYDASKDALDAALIPMKKRCSNASIFRFITPLNDDCERFSINKDATLIALEILQSLSAHQLTENYLPKKLFEQCQEGVKITIEHHDAQLVWATENDQRVLLTVEHLKSVLPHELGDVARLTVGTAIRNSSPAMLLESLPSNWLEEADMTQLISKMRGETFSPFLEKHKSAIQKLFGDQGREIAAHIVTCGNVSEFEEYIENNRDLFGMNENTAAETLSHFWSLAVQRKDTDMLNAVANIYLEAITPSTMISPLFMERLASLLYENLENTSTQQSDMQIEGDMCVAGISYIGDILTKAYENECVWSEDLAELLTARDRDNQPGFSVAMEMGNSRQVSAFGRVLLDAAREKALSSNQLFKLLEAAHKGDSALAIALNDDKTATVTAFGEIVLSAYSMHFLDSKQVCALMACSVGNGNGNLVANIGGNPGPDIVEACGEILLGIDNIASRAGDVAFGALLAPENDDEAALSPTYDKEVVPERLKKLNCDIKSLQSKVKSGQVSAELLNDEIRRLRGEICWNRIALFATRKQERMQIGDMFLEIMNEWNALTQAAPQADRKPS